MVSVHTLGLRMLFLFVLLLAGTLMATAQNNWAEYKAWCESQGGTAYKATRSSSIKCVPRSVQTGETSQPVDNGEAARQAEEKRKADEKAAAEEVERQRLADEAKRKKEAADRQKAFEKDRDETLPLLRDSGGSNSTELRGVDSIGTELRGNGNQDTGLRGSTPYGDPMVVDARNVPSGLPKSVDDAIPHTPAGENMRKGFQAIQSGNWKAALAWFRLGLKKEPHDSSLRRLVDLAEFTLYFRTKPETPVIAPDTSKQTLNHKPANEDKVGLMEAMAVKQMARNARYEAAYKKYDQKYGHRGYSPERHRAATAAANGEGYTDAELKAQLHKALLEYRRMHKGERPADRVGGSVTADEIVIGGKG